MPTVIAFGAQLGPGGGRKLKPRGGREVKPAAAAYGAAHVLTRAQIGARAARARH